VRVRVRDHSDKRRALDGWGIWKLADERSQIGVRRSFRSLTVRIEPHARGEALTLDRVEADGRVTSYSTTLYLDGEPDGLHDGAG
jgi:hypothetical protein